MFRMALLFMLALCLLPVTAAAQEHGEVGVFGEFFRHEETETNHAGIGGRVGFNLHRNVALEGELSYDFGQVFNETFDDGVTTTIGKTDLRVLHGLFGPKFQTSGEKARAFFVVKAGFVNFDVDQAPVTLGTVVGTLDDLRANETNFSLFPGGGFEVFLGPIGVRFDAGDEIYWINGDTRHNLKVTFGPHIQF